MCECVYLLYKYDQKLFRRNTRGASNSTLYECEFADDVALLATTRAAAERAIKTYTSVASSFGMTVSIQKTKFMVVGSGIEDEDLQPIVIEGGEIENVKEFSYLGSLIAENGRIDTEVDKRIANASKAFGALHQAVFKDAHLSINTKRKVYKACVLSVLMYGEECWTPLRKHLKRMNTFHHRCVRTVLGITNKRQWEERLSSEKVREQWGDVETITEKLMKRRLEWLGHLARMPNCRIPKMCLFGWLPKTRPPGGPRRRWRDVAKKDLKAVKIDEDTWYDKALNRQEWLDTCREGVSKYHQAQQQLPRRPKEVECTVCGRQFRRECNKARHKCSQERRRPVREQEGAVRCDVCGRWLRSRGGLAVHKCNREEGAGEQDSSSDVTTMVSAEAGAQQMQSRQGGRPDSNTGVQCSECGRRFRRPGDMKRHKCAAERAKPVEEQRGAVQCSVCQKWFRSKGGLAVHKCRTTG